MSTSFSTNSDTFLPETFILPTEDEEQYNVTLLDILKKISSSVNTKDSGYYITEEIITGQQFVPLFNNPPTTSTSVNYRDVFRKVINTGTLPNAGTSSVAHGIVTTEDYSIVKIYGAATDPGASTITAAIPLPYVNVATPGDGVQLNMDATNINITTTTANYTGYTRSFVIVEYIKVV